MLKRIAFILIVIVVVSAVFYYFRPISIENGVENWVAYKPSTQNISLNSCDDKNFKGSEQPINAGSKAELTSTIGFTLLKTNNPLQWSNKQFREYVNVRCSNANFIPVRAYIDKLLWKKKCTWMDDIIGCQRVSQKMLAWEKTKAQSSDREFNEAGIRFAIPPHLYSVTTSQPSDSAISWNFYTEGNMINDTSSITLQIPKGNSDDVNLNSSSVPEKERVMINWGNLQGDRIVRTSDTQTDSEEWQGTTTTEIYPVADSNMPIELSYSHSIHDDTLETLWSNIHNNVQMDLPSNLGSYQNYVHNSQKEATTPIQPAP